MPPTVVCRCTILLIGHCRCRLRRRAPGEYGGHVPLQSPAVFFHICHGTQQSVDYIYQLPPHHQVQVVKRGWQVMRRKQRWVALELLVSVCSRKTEILQIYGIVIVSRRICHCYSIVSRVSNESNVSSIRSIKQCKHFMWWCYLHLLLNVCKWLFCIPHSPPHRPNNVCDNCIAIVETVWTSCSLIYSFF